MTAEIIDWDVAKRLRQRFLKPSFPGSNPGVPATIDIYDPRSGYTFTVKQYEPGNAVSCFNFDRDVVFGVKYIKPNDIGNLIE